MDARKPSKSGSDNSIGNNVPDKKRWHLDIDVTTGQAGVEELMDRFYDILQEYDPNGFDISANGAFSKPEACPEP